MNNIENIQIALSMVLVKRRSLSDTCYQLNESVLIMSIIYSILIVYLNCYRHKEY